ncbi:hypothetical protein J4573_18430 [Actinomadura barringtoniae]|uniref:Uncharacterized protein n=1 Tax=Actinomadura barringtoniae TaxID=1427535 RepID=A0A939PBD8_9ACTN|nr:hypothetical protein [Actinomadura barringtoniae]MBO2449087.1 hypothetical protein [Actinomadura barringtoniae]
MNPTQNETQRRSGAGSARRRTASVALLVLSLTLLMPELGVIAAVIAVFVTRRRVSLRAWLLIAAGMIGMFFLRWWLLVAFIL